MVIYDLGCEKGHRFEGWFSDRSALEDQRARGLLECTLCGSRSVEKLVTGSAIRRSAEDRAGTVLPAQVGPAPPPPDATAAPDAAPPADAPAATPQQVREFLGTLAAHVRANSQDVGPRFAEEARKIHHGQAAGRAIRGTTTPEEEQALVDEEIPFARLPFLATDD